MPNEITQKINETIEKFRDEADYRHFLTEDDLRGHLYCKLKRALNNYNKASVHAEIRWYGDRRERGTQKLKYRSDIVVIDSRTLDNPTIQNFIVPSKGYGFHDYYAIIELKLRRSNNRESDDHYDIKINNDIQKLKEIRDQTSLDNNPVYWVMLMDKKRRKKITWFVTADGNTITEI